MYLGFCHRYRFVQMYLTYNLVHHCAPVTVLNLLRYGTLHVLQSTSTNTRFEYKLVPEGTRTDVLPKVQLLLLYYYQPKVQVQLLYYYHRCAGSFVVLSSLCWFISYVHSVLLLSSRYIGCSHCLCARARLRTTQQNT